VSTVRRFDALVGTGGIGTGLVLALEGNATLGREESRAARRLDRRDYAKLHIIAHYVQRLLGHEFTVVPVGCVGSDAEGDALLEQLRAEGLDVRHVRRSGTAATLFAVSYVYPDGEGGNITSLGASDTVTPQDVDAAVPVLRRHGGRAVALAVPESPVPARLRLLDAAGRHGSRRVASLASGEIRDGLLDAFLPRCDLIALNLDEATAVLGEDAPAGDPATVAEEAAGRLLTINPSVQVIITLGRHGSCSADRHGMRYVTARPARAVSTAGAGDAHLAGVLVGLSAGVDLHAANRFATVVSGLKVSSPHAINDEITAASVLEASARWEVPLPAGIGGLLAEVAEQARKPLPA
jgi:sugar/nucleoside kinase (ribokinase family)